MLTSSPARRLLVVALCALVPLIGLTGLSVSAQANEDPDGVGLTVSVLGPTGTPTPTATPAAPAAGPRATTPAAPAPVTSTTKPVAPTTTQSTPVGEAAAEALGTDPVVLAGILAVSGLTATAHPNVGPDGGEIDLEFTVKNLTTASIDSTLRFWVDNALGLEIRSVDDLSLTDLPGGETRTVTATLTDVGQFSVYNTHVTLTPPASVDDTELTPMTRDAMLLVPPYFVLLISALAAGLAVAARYALRTRRLFTLGAAELVS